MTRPYTYGESVATFDPDARRVYALALLDEWGDARTERLARMVAELDDTRLAYYAQHYAIEHKLATGYYAWQADAWPVDEGDVRYVPNYDGHWRGAAWVTTHPYGEQVHRSRSDAERWLEQRAPLDGPTS